SGTDYTIPPSPVNQGSIRFLDNRCSIISVRIPNLHRFLMPQCQRSTVTRLVPCWRHMLEAYDFSASHVLADIGVGYGSLVGAVLQRYPKLKGLLFDLSHVVGRARESLKTYGVAERCSVIEGNFFESVPGGADTYLLRHIIHDWSDEQSVQILSNCRKV